MKGVRWCASRQPHHFAFLSNAPPDRAVERALAMRQPARDLIGSFTGAFLCCRANFEESPAVEAQRCGLRCGGSRENQQRSAKDDGDHNRQPRQSPCAAHARACSEIAALAGGVDNRACSHVRARRTHAGGRSSDARVLHWTPHCIIGRICGLPWELCSSSVGCCSSLSSVSCRLRCTSCSPQPSPRSSSTSCVGALDIETRRLAEAHATVRGASSLARRNPS